MRRLALLMLALFAASSAGAQQPGAVRLSELRRASDEELVRLFFGPVGAFPYVGYRDRSNLGNGLIRQRASLWFYSQARATDRAGVCRTERLSIMLERVGPGDRDDPMMQPRQFDLQPIFIVENRDEARRLTNPTSRSRGELEQACAGLDPRRDGIPADYPFQLMQALELIESLGEGARAGRAVMPLDCTRLYWNGPPADEATCLRELAVLRESNVGWVQHCAPQREAPGGCIQVLIHDWFIEFDMNLDQTPRRAVVNAAEDLSQALLAGP